MSDYDPYYYDDFERPVVRRKLRPKAKKPAPAAKAMDVSLVRNANCLMLSVGERRFFTEKKNLRYLVEAAKKLEGQLSVVRVVEGQLLNLKQIVEAYNNPEYTAPNIEYSVLEVRLSCSPEERKSRVTSEEVRTIIRRELLQGNDVSTKSLEETLKDFNLTRQQIKYHFNIVRKSLGSEGYTFAKAVGEKEKEALSPEALRVLQEIMKWKTAV